MSNAPKKLLILYVLEVLRRYSDADHRLNSQQIIDRIRDEYGMECERKAVSRNIALLQEAGFDIAGYRENGTGYYLREREFTQPELRLLIDGVLSSRLIPATQARHLIDKLRRQSSVYFEKRMRHVKSVSEWPRGYNEMLFLTIDLLDEAIDAQRRVTFTYHDFGIDKALHPRREEPYSVSPYQLVSVYGRYYLIANYDGYDNITHYRVDKIKDVKLSEEAARPIADLPAYRNGFNLQDYVNRSIHMMGGKIVQAHIIIRQEHIGDVIDWFGADTKLYPRSDGRIGAKLRASLDGIRCWARQYGPCCEVVEPKILRDMVCGELRETLALYEDPPAEAHMPVSRGI